MHLRGPLSSFALMSFKWILRSETGFWSRSHPIKEQFLCLEEFELIWTSRGAEEHSSLSIDFWARFAPEQAHHGSRISWTWWSQIAQISARNLDPALWRSFCGFIMTARCQSRDEKVDVLECDLRNDITKEGELAGSRRTSDRHLSWLISIFMIIVRYWKCVFTRRRGNKILSLIYFLLRNYCISSRTESKISDAKN